MRRCESRELTPPTGEGCPPKRAARRRAIESSIFAHRSDAVVCGFGFSLRQSLKIFVIFHGRAFARSAIMLSQKRFVYVLRNHESPPKYYTGLTSDLRRRCAEHNAGNCTHTAKHRPWSVDVVIEFADERRAVTFERYLKSGSAVAFAGRHLR